MVVMAMLMVILIHEGYDKVDEQWWVAQTTY